MNGYLRWTETRAPPFSQRRERRPHRHTACPSETALASTIQRLRDPGETLQNHMSHRDGETDRRICSPLKFSMLSNTTHDLSIRPDIRYFPSPPVSCAAVGTPPGTIFTDQRILSLLLSLILFLIDGLCFQCDRPCIAGTARQPPSWRLLVDPETKQRNQSPDVSSAAMSVSFAMVLRLRAVPAAAAGILSFDRAMPMP